MQYYEVVYTLHARQFSSCFVNLSPTHWKPSLLSSQPSPEVHETVHPFQAKKVFPRWNGEGTFMKWQATQGRRGQTLKTKACKSADIVAQLAWHRSCYQGLRFSENRGYDSKSCSWNCWTQHGAVFFVVLNWCTVWFEVYLDAELRGDCELGNGRWDISNPM